MIKQPILLIYPDLLGDYLLFRNHLAHLQTLPFMQNRQIHYVGYAQTRPLVEFLDSNLADQCIWLNNHDDFVLTPRKLIKFPWLVKHWRQRRQALGLPSQVSEIWCPSTGPWVINGLIHSIQATRKLGKDVEDKGLHRLQQWLYTELFQPDSFYTFVFDQHRQFFEQATGTSFGAVQLSFPAERFKGQYRRTSLKSPYCVIFPDSAESAKEWPTEHFATIARHLLHQKGLNIYLCGHGNKRRLGEAILQQVQDERVINLMGETNLVEAFDVIGGSTFVLCNDSFALHAANAMRRPVVCITEGLYQGRYLPYPKPYRLSNHYYAYSLPGEGLAKLYPNQVIALIDDLTCLKNHTSDLVFIPEA